MITQLNTIKESEGIVFINDDDIAEIEIVPNKNGTIFMKTSGRKITISFEEVMDLCRFLKEKNKITRLHGDIK